MPSQTFHSAMQTLGAKDAKLHLASLTTAKNKQRLREITSKERYKKAKQMNRQRTAIATHCYTVVSG